MGFQLSTKTRVFFDSKQLEGKLDKATKATLSKFGAFVRTTAQRSMRKARMIRVSEMDSEERDRYELQKKINKKAGKRPPKRRLAPSEPGKPPRVRAGHLKKFLFFAYDLSKQSVVVGPERLSGRLPGTPQRLEEGGRTRIDFGPNKGRSFNIAPRPYMHPALRKELPKLEPLWRDRLNKV